MRILVAGKTGQVGWELQRSLQCLGEVIAVDHRAFDLAQPALLAAQLDRLRPDVVVNAAAYTAVDKAESEEALATVVNSDAVGAMADWSAKQDALFLHYSTDYVFDGAGQAPWRPADAAAPLSAYGRSKLAGERAVAASGCRHLVLRTSWVYASRGRNFLRTVQRLAAERDELRIVDDQVGAPTSARLVADATAHLIRGATAEAADGRFVSGVLHLTAGGSTSWHGFAAAIVEGLRVRGAKLRCERIVGIPTVEYPTPARRPRNSRLDCSTLEQRFGLLLPDWQHGLALCLDESLA